jgi:hypothetical protein
VIVVTQVQDRLWQEFEDYCKSAYDSGDRPVGHDTSGWVARKVADFYSGKLDMHDAQNAKMISILRQVAEWDTGETAPRITVTRVEEPPPDGGVRQSQLPAASELIDPWANAGAVPVSNTEAGVEQVIDNEVPEGLL